MACVATILEVRSEDLPRPSSDDDPATGSSLTRWLGGLGVGLVPVADPGSFSWPGPWIARLRKPSRELHSVVMYGVPSGVVWDPAGLGGAPDSKFQDGFLIAATDIALAMPALPAVEQASGVIEQICVAGSAGERMKSLQAARAIAGHGLDGDRHVTGRGTFPSGVAGSALTLIEAEVCDSFDPPLRPDEHRRNLVTRGVELNALVGHEFKIGTVLCRGMRLCEPCTVVDGYGSRPLLRALVHRGGLRADILTDGDIRQGDELLSSVGSGAPSER